MKKHIFNIHFFGPAFGLLSTSSSLTMPACCLFAEQAGFQTENSCLLSPENAMRAIILNQDDKVKAQMATVNELKLAIESCKANETFDFMSK